MFGDAFVRVLWVNSINVALKSVKQWRHVLKRDKLVIQRITSPSRTLALTTHLAEEIRWLRFNGEWGPFIFTVCEAFTELPGGMD